MASQIQGGPLALEDCLRALRGQGWSGAVRVHQPQGVGAIFLRSGEVVHAEYGPLNGEFAYWQLLRLAQVALQLDPHAAANRRSIRPLPALPRSWERALGRQLPEPVPAARSPRELPAGNDAFAPAAPSTGEPERPERLFAPLLHAEPQDLDPEPRRGRPVPRSPSTRMATPRVQPRTLVPELKPLLTAALGLVVGIVLGGYWGNGENPAPPLPPQPQAALALPSRFATPATASAVLPTTPSPIPAGSAPPRASTARPAPPEAAQPLDPAARAALESAAAQTRARESLIRAQTAAREAALASAVEVSALAAGGGAPPQLLEAPSPASPDPQYAVAPEIALRLLVDEQGAVARAAVRAPRPDLARFEGAALQAARGYRFRPARRQGQAIAVWLDASVRFP